jgi:hypothetical protein
MILEKEDENTLLFKMNSKGKESFIIEYTKVK